jgi:hypothetical protein
MNKVIFLIISLIALVFISCGGEEIFAGRAYRMKAESGLKEIRNALEKYMLKNGRYPSKESWERELIGYFRKDINPDPDWITKRKMSVMRASTKITQCEGVIKELKKDLIYADSSLQADLSVYLYPIDSALTLAGYEIKEARSYDYRNIENELKGLESYISGINTKEKKNEIINLMVRENEELDHMSKEVKSSLLVRDSLRKSDLIVEESVWALFLHIEDKLNEPLLEVQGQPVSALSDTADTIPLYANSIRDQIKKLAEILDSKKDSALIRKLNEFDSKMISYVNGDQKIAFVGKLFVINKKIPATISLFKSFYLERDRVLNDNRVLNGYSSLGNLVSMVKRYEDENGSLPRGNLYELFKEEESMKEIRKDLASDPYLEVLDNGYRLRAEAQDSDRTPLVMDVAFYNNYADLVKESFSAGPYYETDDMGTTYFIWVKAGDVEKTILAARPKTVKEKED